MSHLRPEATSLSYLLQSLVGAVDDAEGGNLQRVPGSKQGSSVCQDL